MSVWEPLFLNISHVLLAWPTGASVGFCFVLVMVEYWIKKHCSWRRWSWAIFLVNTWKLVEHLKKIVVLLSIVTSSGSDNFIVLLFSVSADSYSTLYFSHWLTSSVSTRLPTPSKDLSSSLFPWIFSDPLFFVHPLVQIVFFFPSPSLLRYFFPRIAFLQFHQLHCTITTIIFLFLNTSYVCESFPRHNESRDGPCQCRPFPSWNLCDESADWVTARSKDRKPPTHH